MSAIVSHKYRQLINAAALPQTITKIYSPGSSPVRIEGLSIVRMPETVLAIEIDEDRYAARLARNPAEVDAALRLRFEVFNIELREGLDASFATGRDEDRFDGTCDHLIVIARATGAVVGTYRLRTPEMTNGDAAGFYCAGEFALENLPPAVLTASLEIGRACIRREHRNTHVLFLLWKGLAAYTEMNNKRYLFGCCSLTSQDEHDGWMAARMLKRENHFHPDFFVAPREEHRCTADGISADEGEKFELTPPFFHLSAFQRKSVQRAGDRSAIQDDRLFRRLRHRGTRRSVL